MAKKTAVRHSEEILIKVDGIEIAYDTFGEPSNPPMLLIMGLGAQMISWPEEFCSQLAARGFWVIRFDNRDIGASTRLDHAGVPDLFALLQGRDVSAPYTLEDMAQDSVGLLDGLGIDSAHIVGASMGGMIVQTIGINHPNRMRTMVSIMSTTGNPDLPRAKPDVEMLLVTPTPQERAAYIDYQVDIHRILCGTGFPFHESHIRDLAGCSFDRGLNPAGFARQLAAIIVSGSRKEALSSLNIPTLVIHGDADPLVPVEGGIDTADAIPGAKLIVIEGMGHDLPIEAWPRILDAISEHANSGDK